MKPSSPTGRFLPPKDACKQGDGQHRDAYITGHQFPMAQTDHGAEFPCHHHSVKDNQARSGNRERDMGFHHTS